MRPIDPKRVCLAVGRRVAEIRRAKGWTQEHLAERMDTSVQYLRRIELGAVAVTITQLVRVSNTLGVKPGALFERPATLAVRRGRPRGAA